MSYLDRLKRLDDENCPDSLLPKLPQVPFDSNGSSPAGQFQKKEQAAALPAAANFWSRVGQVRPHHENFLNHIMACLKCYAPRNRYCSRGQELRQALQLAWSASEQSEVS